MLYYEKRLLGLPLLLRGVGSVLPRAVFPALVAAGLSLVFELTVPHEVLAELFVHPYPFQVFAYIVAFALVFRTNVGYNRYWEGRTQAAQMASKWGDAAAGALSYDMHARDDNEEIVRARAEWQALLIHRFSLLHALAMQYVRRERDLDTLSLAREDNSEDSHEASLGFSTPSRRQSTPARASILSPGSLLSPTRPPRTPTADSLPQNLSLTRERSDTAVAASQERNRRSSTYVEQSARQSIAASKTAKLQVSASRVFSRLPVLGGVDADETRVLREVNDRVGFVFELLLSQLNARHADGGLWVPPPILSRTHQVLSDGMLGFQQMRKVEDTPFPFPYAQIVAFFLCVFTLLFPLIAASKISTEDPYTFWIAPLLSFFTVGAYWGLHEVARDLEDPFISALGRPGPNDLPAATLQRDFNQRLRACWDALRATDAAQRASGAAPLGNAPGLRVLEQWKHPEAASKRKFSRTTSARVTFQDANADDDAPAAAPEHSGWNASSRSVVISGNPGIMSPVELDIAGVTSRD